MRTPFAVVAALMGGQLIDPRQCRYMDSSDPVPMSLAQADLEEGMTTVRIKSKKTEFEEEDDMAEDDNTGYGHYSSVAQAEEQDDDPMQEDADKKTHHHKQVKSHKKEAKHHHKEHEHKQQNLAPAEPNKQQKAAEKAGNKAEAAKKAAAAKAAKASPNPPPVKGMPPIKNIDRLDGRMIILRGQHGPKYSFGQARPIKNDKEQIKVVAKPFNPRDQTQRLAWDARTKSLRLFHRKDFALSLYKGDEKEKFQLATIRKWINGPVQKNYMYNGHLILPWKPTMKLCLQFTAFHPGSPLTWLPCRKTELQGFSIQVISFKTLRNNRERRVVLDPKFRIDQASGHVLYIRGNHGPKYTIGHQKVIRRLSDEQLVINKAFNTENPLQRWYWDKRSQSFRLFHQRHFALSFKLKSKRYGTPASVRLFKNELTQKHKWLGTKIETEFNKWTKFCLGNVHFAPNSVLTWQACRKTPFQNFQIMAVTIQEKMRKTRKPRVEEIVTGTANKVQKQFAKALKKPIWSKKFYLELNMKGARRIYMSAQQDGPDKVCKLKSGINDWRAWFIMDQRTRSIRLDAHRSLALSNRDGYNRLNVGKTIAFRKYDATADQIDLEIKEGSKKGVFTIINKAKKCLTTQNYQNKDENLLMWWHCNKNPTQSWKRFFQVPEKKLKGKPWQIPFFIESGMPGNRKVYVSKQKTGADTALKITKDVNDWRAIWIVDQRTQSIRLHANRSLAISNTDTKIKRDRLKTGKNAVVRKFDGRKGTVDQRFVKYDKGKITNKNKRCLSTRHYANKDETLLTWWKCNKNPSQKWSIKLFKNKQVKSFEGIQTLAGPAAPRLNLNLDKIDQQMIIVRGQVEPKYSLAWSGRVVAQKRVVPELKLITKPFNMLDKAQHFVWEKRTKTLRPYHHRTYVLSFDNKLGYFPGKFGSKAIFKNFKKEPTQTINFTGQFITQYKLNKFCLQPINLQPGSEFEWEACQRINTQMFTINKITFMRRTKTGHKKIKFTKAFPTQQADGNVVLFRGAYGPRYTIGIWGRIRKQTDEPFVRTRVLNHKDTQQQWTWDTRSKSIRLYNKRDFALSMKLTGNFVTARKWENKPSQILKYDGRLHVKFRGSEYHLTFANFRPLAPVKWEPFDKTETQKLQAIIIKPREFKRQNDRPRIAETIDAKGDHIYPELRHKDTKPEPKFSKRFMLELAQAKGPLRLIVSKQINGKDRVAKLDKNRIDWRAWFVYDDRTKSIRQDSHRYLALSNQDGLNRMNVGKTAAFRKYTGTVDQRDVVIKATTKKGIVHIVNAKKKCLNPDHFQAKDNNFLTWWHCNQNPTQKWKRIWTVPMIHPKGKMWESPFHIFNNLPGHRHLYISSQKVGHDHIIKVNKDIKDFRAIWIVDQRTRSIRQHSDRNIALSVQDSIDQGAARLKKGRLVTARTFKNQYDQEIWFDKKHIVNRAKQCLQLTNHKNKDEVTVNFWKCDKSPSQNWTHKTFALKHEDPNLPAPELRKLSEKPMQVTADKAGKKPAEDSLEKKPTIQAPTKKQKNPLHGAKFKNTHKQVGTAPAVPEPANKNHPLAIKNARAQIRALKREEEDAQISRMVSEIAAKKQKDIRENAQALAQQNTTTTQPTLAENGQQATSIENVKETINTAYDAQPANVTAPAL